MRKIKFRAKRSNSSDWVYGDLVHHDSVSAGHNLNTYIKRHGFHYVVDECTVGQFTGLTDKNGTEIYEGDVVLHKTYHGKRPCIVRFKYGAFIVGYHEGSSTKRTPMLINKSCVVIGNIHDNPELLRKEGNQ